MTSQKPDLSRRRTSQSRQFGVEVLRKKAGNNAMRNRTRANLQP
ncbi:unnamed protein product [Ixodes pacificus]